MGRKPIEIDLAEVERLAGLGLTEQEICDCIGISTDTLGRRKRDSADFADAVKRGKAIAHADIANTLRELCREKNLGAVIWYEKTRCGLSEKIQVEASAPQLAPARGNSLANFTAGSNGHSPAPSAEKMLGDGSPLGQDSPRERDGSNDGL